ncbi:TPA: MBL fold metallo-hydrolase [Klebsiella pneumoniae]
MCEGISPGTRRMLDSLMPQPASIQKPNFDIVAWNDSFCRLMGIDFATLPEEDRNCIYLYLTHETWRSRIENRDVLPTFVSYFRAAMAEHRGDPAWENKLARFFAASSEFEALWHQRYEVRGVENQIKHFNHPQLGRFSLQQMYWYSAPRNGSRLLVYLPMDEAGEQAQLSQVEASPHYRDGQFHNQLPTPGFTGQKNMLAAWWDFLMTKRENARPAQPLPLVKTDLATLPLGQDVMVWLGHSSWYLQLAGKRILIDPVFSDYAAPFSFINKAFPGDYPWRAEGMPEIDLLIISHDHYDHLDYATIRALLPKIKRVITPLGVGSHLRYWGMDGALITEADWQQAVPASDELTVHVLPARHFSGRGLKRNQTLWASFLFVTRQQKIYYSGDSGYGPHFKAIGDEFGPVDLAIMENGQYDQDWKYIHMMPDETAQAADDLRARAVLPGHAGRFVLAKHSWDEPYQRLAAASEGRAWRLLTPVQGEPVWVADKTQSFNAWWR